MKGVLRALRDCPQFRCYFYGPNDFHIVQAKLGKMNMTYLEYILNKKSDSYDFINLVRTGMIDYEGLAHHIINITDILNNLDDRSKTIDSVIYKFKKRSVLDIEGRASRNDKIKEMEKDKVKIYLLHRKIKQELYLLMDMLDEEYVPLPTEPSKDDAN